MSKVGDVVKLVPGTQLNLGITTDVLTYFVIEGKWGRFTEQWKRLMILIAKNDGNLPEYITKKIPLWKIGLPVSLFPVWPTSQPIIPSLDFIRICPAKEYQIDTPSGLLLVTPTTLCGVVKPENIALGTKGSLPPPAASEKIESLVPKNRRSVMSKVGANATIDQGMLEPEKRVRVIISLKAGTEPDLRITQGKIDNWKQDGSWWDFEEIEQEMLLEVKDSKGRLPNRYAERITRWMITTNYVRVPGMIYVCPDEGRELTLKTGNVFNVKRGSSILCGYVRPTEIDILGTEEVRELKPPRVQSTQTRAAIVEDVIDEWWLSTSGSTNPND